MTHGTNYFNVFEGSAATEARLEMEESRLITVKMQGAGKSRFFVGGGGGGGNFINVLLYSGVHLAPSFAYICSRAVETLESIRTAPHSRKDAVFGELKEATKCVQVIKARPKTKGLQRAGQMGRDFSEVR